MFTNALLLWLAGGFKRVASAMGGVARWVGGSAARIWAAVAIVALALAGWQAMRAGQWAQKARATQAAWNAERDAAQAAKLAAEARYRSLADDADADHAAVLAQGDARLAAYIAAHRVQPARSSDPARAATDHGADFPANPAADPDVAKAPVIATISEADLKICDANYVYASAAHDWAARLNP